MPLNETFYTNPDVVSVARELIGNVLCVNNEGTILKGIIVETEAYSGRDDKACHANNGKYTSRTAVFYRQGGLAYVYLCYGVHYMMNVVTNVEGHADAVLIRAVEPIENVDVMQQNRPQARSVKSLTNGPGKLCQALGIKYEHNGKSLLGNDIWIENGSIIPMRQIGVSKRIGVEYAGEDAMKPWRFFDKKSNFVSK